MKKKEVNPGLIWVPYVMVERSPNDPPDKEYQDFMTEYKEKHKCCPKCGGINHSTTLMAFLFNRDKKNEYKDENTCTCSDCGNRHTKHERNNPELNKNNDRFDKLKNILE